MNAIDAYAASVVRGDVPAGKYHRLACQRHVNDRAREATPGFPYRFSLDHAERFFRFSSQLRHYKGKWSGQFVVLTPIQQFRLGCIFGWRRTDKDIRRVRTAYNELPRKQGKSLEAAIVALYVAFFDGEPGAEGYCIATKRDQAKIVFNDAKKLVTSSGLKSRLKVQVSNIHKDSTASKLEPLGADHDSTDGLNPNLIIVDELHAHKTRDLIDVMETATGAREQPLNFQITTAGDDPVSPCGDQHDYACKILDGTLVDETFFCIICHADEGDDWMDEKTWAKANPHYGVSVNPDDMRALALKAKGIPAAAATFKQKRLNLWVNASAPCLSVEGWRKGQSALSREAFMSALKGKTCYVGVDLASKLDFCSASALFPPDEDSPKWRVVQRIWTPAETLKDRAHLDRAPYQVWVDQGWLTALPGTSIDHDVVRQAILEWRDLFSIENIGFDPWHAEAPIKALVAIDGFSDQDVLEVPQTFAGISSACLRVQAEIASKNVDADGCPVTAWSVSNVAGQTDNKNNLQFSKKKSRGRIDPVVSIATAMALALRGAPAERQFQMLFVGASSPVAHA